MGRLNIPDMHRIRKILIIRGSAIGDVLHATPLAAALKSSYPHLHITWITEEICGPVVEGNPYLDEVIVVPRSRWKRGRFSSPQVWKEYLGFLADLRSRKFDLTLDIQGYAKSAVLALATGAPYRLGWWRMRDGAQIVSRPIPRLPSSRHRVDWFLDVARALGVEQPVVRFALNIPERSREEVQELLASVGGYPHQGYAVLNRAAGDSARRWTVEGFGELAWILATRYGLRSILVGVEKDREANQAIIAVYNKLKSQSLDSQSLESQKDESGSALWLAEPVDLAGRTDLKQLFALIEKCRIQISGDTGSLHIAAALNRPLVAIFGSSDPEHAGPWGYLDRVVAHREVCSKLCSVRQCALSQKSTPSPHKRSGDDVIITDRNTSLPESETSSICLQRVGVEEVLAMVDRALC